ncbi:zinc finger BED domain-containing protein 5-like [Schistocerca piceifrons]|uniref:zinc finger BED domain-containing protein 5-like n=1 Tax=Schistocerca piceifrons TaxID=274613 RepID=UPI001F5F81A7|nr:zinc finger BED domain-containing protein 5-like [Schistocerca piceifrons]
MTLKPSKLEDHLRRYQPDDVEFLETKDPNLKENLIKFKADIACLTDLFNKFNEVNLQLQGDSLNLIKMRGVISAFLGKLKFIKQNISRHEFSPVPNLSHAECLDEGIQTYAQQITLHDDFKNRFENILTMEIPPWLINPFDQTEVAIMVLLELNTNEELKVKFKNGYQTFWLQAEIPEKYPGLWETARKFSVAFLSSYLVEKSFSYQPINKKKEQTEHHRTGRFEVIPYKTEAKY